jgi:hypothetical protein
MPLPAFVKFKINAGKIYFMAGKITDFFKYTEQASGLDVK